MQTILQLCINTVLFKSKLKKSCIFRD